MLCERWVESIKGIEKPEEKLSRYGQVKRVKSGCYLGYWLNASDGNEALATAITRILDR